MNPPHSLKVDSYCFNASYAPGNNRPNWKLSNLTILRKLALGSAGFHRLFRLGPSPCGLRGGTGPYRVVTNRKPGYI
jgi:hypothetical protein